MSINDQPDLLFFDTFSHDTSEELNLDLVQFPKSVFVREIRVIPLGARVQGDFPGGVRLGATNPTQFQIDFFVNDLSKPGACTFESLGSLEYSQNGSIHMECITTAEKPRIPTDGLVLRGCYTTITLAVYGNLTQSSSDVQGPIASQARPSMSQEIVASIPPAREWNTESNPIATYTATVAAANPDYEGNYAPESYENELYREDYYEGNEPPKDPRTYHANEGDWEKMDMGCDRMSPRLEHGRDRERRDERTRRRSHDSRDSSRHRDRSRDERRSLSREYLVKGEYRHSRSRSRSRDRKRALSTEQEWDRSSYKKEEYRRQRGDSYERGGSYERRTSPYDKRGPSYERKYEKHSPYDKRASSYERQMPYDKKRLSPYSRTRDPSYSSQSPSAEDPRKRPRTPPRGLSDEGSPIIADEGSIEYDRNGKPVPRVDFYQSYRHKSSIRSPSQEGDNGDNVPYIESQHPSLVNVQLVDSNASPGVKESPKTIEAERSMEEPFEPILSDEDICDDGPPYMDMDYDVSDYCDMEDVIKYYSPFKSEWVKHDFKNKPYLLKGAERGDNGKDVLNASFDELAAVCPDLLKIYELSKSSKKREQIFSPSTFADMGTSSREEWVHKCEQLCLLITNVCKDTDIILRIFQNTNRNDDNEFHDIYNLLIAFTKIGLNLDLALKQHISTYKIRHMKCGIRLAEALVAHRYNSDVVKALLKCGINVSLQLFELYTQEYIALSIRLMVLKALSGYLSSKVAVDSFMQQNMYPKIDKSDKENKPKNGYQVLICIMQSNPLARIKYALSCLIKKLNMYELLEKVNKLVTNFNIISSENEKCEEPELSHSEVEFIVSSLDEVLHTYRTRCLHLSQPKRFLPASAQFDINIDCSNDILLEFFQEHHFLDVCLYLLTCPATCSNLVIISPIHDLVYELVHSVDGLKFLYKNMNVAELLFKILMQPYTQQNSEDFHYHHDLSSYNDLQILGFDMAYRLKALQCIESICDLQMGNFEENDLIDRLQELFCLSYGNIGKLCVPGVIVNDDYVECLIAVLERGIRSKAKSEPSSKHRSPAKGYAIDLIVAAVKFSADLPFLKRYGATIYNIVKEHEQFEPSVSCLLQELIPYLKPIENATLLNGEDLAECVDILKSNVEAAADVPGEIITALRVLQHYCLPTHERDAAAASDSATDQYIELKYKYNILQLFSFDGIAHLCAILDRLSTHFEQPGMHTSCFVATKGLHVAQIVLPALRLIDDMLARVVKCRGSRFRDLTAAPVLLKTYGLVRAFPPGCVAYRTAVRAAEAAVRALLAYAQPAADDADSIKHGPWTSLCSAVIDYTMTAPHTFVPGLLVFSELLPLPLPMQSKIAPTSRELSDASNERRLWSAHLYALGDELVDMIQIICMSTYRPVVHMLRRVCVQIADLAPNTAATVARAVVGVVTRELSSGGPATASGSRVLGFLACLVAHAPVKCAVLHAMSAGGARAGEILTAICNVLSLKHTSAEHATAQEYAALVLVGFFDAEVSLTPTNGNMESVISNSLPSKEALACFLEASADCLSASRNCTVASSILRGYFVLTEYEFGFQQFRKSVHKKKECFDKFFKWLVECSGDETMECLSLFIDLLRILCSEEGEGALGRKSMLSVSELAQLLGCPGEGDEHAATLESKLRAKNAEEDVLANAAFLTCYLSKSVSPPPPSPALSPPPISPLVHQFSSRAVHTDSTPVDVQRLTSGYWLSLPDATADEEGGEEMVLCDISELAHSSLPEPGWLQAALRELAGLVPTVLDPIIHRPTVCVPESRVLSVCDTFRSRPPNTSRPPSLHVDDFTARQLQPPYSRGVRRGSGTDRGRFASQTPHHPLYRHMRGRGAWEMGGQHFGHFPTAPYMMGGMGWGGVRMQRAPRHRNFMR